ncbi:uncharacterized protein [Setaria viridis]|uniref:Uncharacterized protein n=1 Tax=Setaria viridis TaxID=4556 RepID=A0A4U6UW30_SETVI|nr:hypothetical protein SEVIR_4G036801v2 [Setaria viridis]
MALPLPFAPKSPIKPAAPLLRLQPTLARPSLRLRIEPGLAVQTAFLSAKLVYQTEKEKAFSPASRKPQEKVASGDTRKGRAWSSTERVEPAPSCDGAGADEHGESE